MVVEKNKDWSDMQESLMSWHDAVSKVELAVHSLPDNERFVIWGAGAHTEYLYQLTSFFHKKSHCKFIIVDSDTLKHGTSWRGINIYSPDVLGNINWNSTGLLVSSYGSQDTIENVAISLDIPKDSIFKLYDRIRIY